MLNGTPRCGHRSRATRKPLEVRYTTSSRSSSVTATGSDLISTARAIGNHCCARMPQSSWLNVQFEGKKPSSRGLSVFLRASAETIDTCIERALFVKIAEHSSNIHAAD